MSVDDFCEYMEEWDKVSYDQWHQQNIKEEAKNILEAFLLNNSSKDL